MDNLYSGHELVKAIIRTINRAGPDGLSESDVNYVWDTAEAAAYTKLSQLNKAGTDSKSDGQVYAVSQARVSSCLVLMIILITDITEYYCVIEQNARKIVRSAVG